MYQYEKVKIMEGGHLFTLMSHVNDELHNNPEMDIITPPFYHNGGWVAVVGEKVEYRMSEGGEWVEVER